MPTAAKKINLTDRALRALKPAGKRVTIWDAIQPGMAVQIGARGKPSFYVVRRMPGAAQPTWRKLGDYPTLALVDAREATREALRALMAGQDPAALEAAKRRTEAAAARESAANTFTAVAERFIEWYRTTPGRGDKPRRRADDVAAVIRRELVPRWEVRPISEITDDDVIAVIEAIRLRGGAKAAPGGRRRTGGPYAARHAFAAARLLFDWARRPAAGRLIATDPVAGINPRDDLNLSPAARDRVLNDEEIRVVWAAAGATPYPYGPLIQLLLLTGARLREWAEASWGEIDLAAATLTVPTHRMKMRIAHVIPLTPAALAIVEALPRFAGGGFLFSTTAGCRPISGYSKFRAKFNVTLADIPAFTIHDLRRTCRTNLAGLDVPEEYAERVIGHQPQGIRAVYDLHRYDRQKREALTLWEARLLSIVAPEPPASVVVPMRGRR